MLNNKTGKTETFIANPLRRTSYMNEIECIKLKFLIRLIV